MSRKWEKPFNEKFTTEGDFHINKNLTVKVPFMSKTGFYKGAVLDEATLVSVPYKGNASALFILPKEGKMKAVELHKADIVKKFKSHCHTDLVDLRIPKFTIAGEVDLKQVLPKMGIVEIFSNTADFSGITKDQSLKISQAVHKVKINVDEMGTEAAGATVMEAVPMRLPMQMNYDHPFLYSIYDHETKTILFLGKVVNPKN
ncbi:alpha-1-antiproteinase-like [Lithobates pipiens]